MTTTTQVFSPAQTRILWKGVYDYKGIPVNVHLYLAPDEVFDRNGTYTISPITATEGWEEIRVSGENITNLKLAEPPFKFTALFNERRVIFYSFERQFNRNTLYRVIPVDESSGIQTTEVRGKDLTRSMIIPS